MSTLEHEPEAIRSRGMVLVLACAVSLILIVSVTLMTVSLPHIQRDLDLADHDLQWIVAGYGLTFGGLLLVGGRLSDFLGRRTALIVGLVIFIVGAILCFVAPTGWILIAGRTIQGVGGALSLPAAMALVTSSFTEPRQRSFALGVWGAIGASGAVLGNVSGGFLSALASWRWAFVPVVVVGILVLALSPFFLPRGRPDRSRPLALGNGALVTIAIGLAIFGLSRSSIDGFASWTTAIPLVLAVIATGSFIAVERRSRSPLIPLEDFRRRDALGFAFVALSSGMTTGAYYFSSLFMQNIRGFSGLEAGLAFGLWAATIIAGSQATPWLLRRFSARSLLISSFVVATVGLLVLGVALSTSTDFFPWIAISFVAIGAGGGVASVSGTVTALSTLPDSRQGLASGVLNAAQQVASVLALAVLVSVQVAEAGLLRESGVTDAAAQVGGMKLAIYISAVLGLGATVLAIVGLRPQRADPGALSTEARLTEDGIGDAMV